MYQTHYVYLSGEQLARKKKRIYQTSTRISGSTQALSPTCKRPQNHDSWEIYSHTNPTRIYLKTVACMGKICIIGELESLVFQGIRERSKKFRVSLDISSTKAVSSEIWETYIGANSFASASPRNTDNVHGLNINRDDVDTDWNNRNNQYSVRRVQNFLQKYSWFLKNIFVCVPGTKNIRSLQNNNALCHNNSSQTYSRHTMNAENTKEIPNKHLRLK